MAKNKVNQTTSYMYPEEMDSYFKKNNVSIKSTPEKYNLIDEKNFKNITFSSAEQLYNFLYQELEFWSEQYNLENDYLGCYNKVKSAISLFDNAKHYYSNNDTNDGNYNLNASIGYISTNYLCSQTNLAQYISSIRNKQDSFFNGFYFTLQNNDNATFNYNLNMNILEGIIAGLRYRGDVKVSDEYMVNYLPDYAENFKLANENFVNLNSKYNIAFHEQENRIAEIQEKTNEEIDNLKNASERFFKEREQNIKNLEEAYSDKLKLAEPAKYWNDMAKSYSKQGKWWLLGSVGVAIATIALLICVLIFVPNIFDNAHWIDLIKNSAIITLIASIAIYLLRTFIKMALSSIHLSRDAKEREQLSYFYLALKSKGAVSDTEQALVINSLFSRADTGLLKGDSSPSMSANVTDVVEKLKS